MRLLVIDEVIIGEDESQTAADRVIDFTGLLPADPKLIDCSDEYNKLRGELRKKYVEYVAWLGDQKVSGRTIKERFLLEPGCSLWWFGEIVHKDSFSDPFFDDLCKAVLIGRLKERLGIDDVMVMAPQGSLLKSIFAGERTNTLLLAISSVVSRLRFMINYLRIKNRLRKRKMSDSAPPGTLFFSYYPNLWNKSSKGVFSDRIFRDLPSRIKDHGYILCLGAVNDSLSEISRAAYIQNNLSIRKIILQFLDFRNAVKYLLIRAKMRKLFFFEGVDISVVYDRYMWETVLMDDYRFSLITAGVANLVGRLLPKRIISSGEFSAMARAVVVGAKKHNVPVFWLQHGVISRRRLWYFYQPEEIVGPSGEINDDLVKRMPVADCFLVWGEKSIEVLCGSGYPINRLRVVGNPSYDGFLNSDAGEPTQKDAIVFTSSIDAKEIKVFAGFALDVKNKWPDRNVIIKLHPRYKDILLEFETELEAIRCAGVKIATEPIDRFFDRSNIFINGVSTTAVEAAYHGVQIITYLSKYHDRFTPDWTDNGCVVYSSEELIDVINNAEKRQPLAWESYFLAPGLATTAVITELSRNVSNLR